MQSADRQFHHVQKRYRHGPRDIGVVVVGGIARHRQKPGALGLEPARHGEQRGQRTGAVTVDKCGDARGHLRIVVHQQAYVILIVARRRRRNDALHQIHRRLRTHAAQNTERKSRTCVHCAHGCPQKPGKKNSAAGLSAAHRPSTNTWPLRG